ncbi:MAG: response regulator [Deltaproteobacteria bacterium]|nr:response regulator [Deltaproteobacteria bacterium]
MVQSLAPELFLALGSAVRNGQDRFVVHVTDEAERTRVVGALSLEGAALAAESVGRAMACVAEGGLELAIFDVDREAHDLDPLVACTELGSTADLVLLMDGDPAKVSDAFVRGAFAVLPRPLPTSDALLRAHIRWLASSRRSRVRGVALRGVLARYRTEIEALDKGLWAVLSPLLEDEGPAARVLVIGDPELAQLVGGSLTETSADVVVIGAGPNDVLESRLTEARSRAPGSATIVVDAAPDAARLSAAIYGGARAYIERSRQDSAAAVVKSVASRKQSEVKGRRLVEGVARFGLFDHRNATATTKDVDAKLLVDATSKGSPFVPSGHEVLVVDDEVVVLTVLREALRRGGYKVTTASSAQDAITQMRARPFDLVLTDKNLAGASGLDVLRFARTLDPPPAVVLITGYSSYDSAVEAMETGALDYIEKPIKDVELLRQRVRRALCRRDEQMTKAQLDEFAPTKRSVLLVEEQEGRRKLLNDFLGRTYQVVAVATGALALEKLQQQRFDVVLADRNLPGMTGKRVIEQAQQLLPHCASVLYTAYPSYESIQEAFEVGADAYLVRPTEDMKALEEKVAGALRSHGILLG